MSRLLRGVVLAGILLLVTRNTVAAQALGGRWALSSSACDGERFTRAETPLIVEGLAIRWFNLACTVVSSYKVGQALFLQGRCSGEGRNATIPIMLEPRGDRLRVGWDREPVRDMQRCHWTDAFGYRWAAPDAVIKGP